MAHISPLVLQCAVSQICTRTYKHAHVLTYTRSCSRTQRCRGCSRSDQESRRCRSASTPSSRRACFCKKPPQVCARGCVCLVCQCMHLCFHFLHRMYVCACPRASECMHYRMCVCVCVCVSVKLWQECHVHAIFRHVAALDLFKTPRRCREEQCKRTYMSMKAHAT